MAFVPISALSHSHLQTTNYSSSILSNLFPPPVYLLTLITNQLALQSCKLLLHSHIFSFSSQQTAPINNWTKLFSTSPISHTDPPTYTGNEITSLSVAHSKMALMSENGTALHRENFEEFYIRWKEKQNLHLHDLITTATEPSSSSSLPGLVDRVISHYEEYYRVKSKCIKTDVLLILSAPWKTALEDAFNWVGGWRPSAAFHLLYSKSGLQLESKLSEQMKGVGMVDLGDLSSAQLSLMDKLQRITIQREREISEKVAKRQERVADQEMVELSHHVSELARTQGRQSDNSEMARAVASTLTHKEEDFQMVVQSADNLRLKTLKGIVDILSPIQAVHFLIAAAELNLSIHDWGKVKEEMKTGS